MSQASNWLRAWDVAFYDKNKRPIRDAAFSSEVFNTTFDEKNHKYEKVPYLIQFDVTKNIQKHPAVGVLRIYNLPRDLELEISELATKLAIQCGYYGTEKETPNLGVIFTGEIVQMVIGYDGNKINRYLEIYCLSTDMAISHLNNGLTIPAKSTRKEIIQAILKASGATADMSTFSNQSAFDNSEPKTERPKVVFGDPMDSIDDLIKLQGSTLYWDDQQLKCFGVKSPKAPDFTNTTTLDFKNGLISFPSWKGYYMTCKSLINPQIKLGDFVKLKLEDIMVAYTEYMDIAWSLDQGSTYRVISINYKGSTRGNDWYMEIQAVSQAGTIPAELQDRYGRTLR